MKSVCRPGLVALLATGPLALHASAQTATIQRALMELAPCGPEMAGEVAYAVPAGKVIGRIATSASGICWMTLSGSMSQLTIGEARRTLAVRAGGRQWWIGRSPYKDRLVREDVRAAWEVEEAGRRRRAEEARWRVDSARAARLGDEYKATELPKLAELEARMFAANELIAVIWRHDQCRTALMNLRPADVAEAQAWEEIVRHAEAQTLSVLAVQYGDLSATFGNYWSEFTAAPSHILGVAAWRSRWKPLQLKTPLLVQYSDLNKAVHANRNCRSAIESADADRPSIGIDGRSVLFAVGALVATGGTAVAVLVVARRRRSRIRVADGTE